MRLSLERSEPSSADRAVESRPGTARVRHAPAWLLEGVFIVASVALGFAVTQYGEHRAERELAGRALASLRAEIEHNTAVLAPMVPTHVRWAKALAKADRSTEGRSGIDVLFATRPPLPPHVPSPFPFLRQSAWDATVSGGALRLIDYGVAADLSEIYRVQETVNRNIDRLANGALSTTATYEPRSRDASVRLLWLTLLDIESAEAVLLDLYRKDLPAVRRAAAAER